MTTRTKEAVTISSPASDEVRERYRIEREKRLRSEGNEQFVPLTEVFADFDEDPHADRGFHRGPIEDEVDVVVVGGGFGGLVAAANLRKQGLQRIRVIDRAADFGGTWYWNRYPGAQCDIESYIYLPLLEETGFMPTRRYVSGSEIFEYAQMVGKHYSLYDDALFQTVITSAVWDEERGRWVIGTDRGDMILAEFVVLSSGPLSRPKLPGVPGISDFEGQTFHTSRWDYDYTGGSTLGELTGLADKRVGLIGTGATAIQVVPHLGDSAEELFVFQRTPSSVSARLNRPTDPDWFASQQHPGWQLERMENFNQSVMGQRPEIDLIQDSWTFMYNKVASWKTMDPNDGDLAAAAEAMDLVAMEEIRARIAEIVIEPATADLLKPWYRLFCKRPCFSDTYLETFNRPNVTLVDTDGQGVDRITATGVVVAGTEYALDCLVFATGFEVGTSFTERAGFDPVGRDGQTLSQAWEKGHRTLHGIVSHGFPNFFFTGVVQAALVTNFVHLATEQSESIAHVISAARTRHAYVEPTAAAEETWVAEIRKPSPGRALLLACTPGFYNNEGKLDEPGGWVAESYGPGSIAYFDLLHDWRRRDGGDDLAFTTRAVGGGPGLIS